MSNRGPENGRSLHRWILGNSGNASWRQWISNWRNNCVPIHAPPSGASRGQSSRKMESFQPECRWIYTDVCTRNFGSQMCAVHWLAEPWISETVIGEFQRIRCSFIGWRMETNSPGWPRRRQISTAPCGLKVESIMISRGLYNIKWSQHMVLPEFSEHKPGAYIRKMPFCSLLSVSKYKRRGF